MVIIQLGGKMKRCFECRATEDLQEHHVVPKSSGGTKTVTLCHQCHMKAHGRDGKGLHHSRLVKEGLKKAKERGARLGSHNQTIKKAAEQGKRRQSQKSFNNFYPMILQIQKHLEQNGKKPSGSAIARLLNEKGVLTPSGKGKWQSKQVIRILKRANQEGK